MSLAGLNPLGQSLALLFWSLRDAYLSGTVARPSQSSPPVSRQPRPLGDMPRRATGGRQGGGTAWHHQTTAPGGRWQHQVQMPRTIQPKVQAGTSSTCMAWPLPGRLARGPFLKSPWSRLPPPPQSTGPTLPRLHLLPHFPQLQGAGGGRHRCSWRLGRTPCPSRHQSALHPQPGRSHSGTAGSSLKNIS